MHLALAGAHLIIDTIVIVDCVIHAVPLISKFGVDKLALQECAVR